MDSLVEQIQQDLLIEVILELRHQTLSQDDARQLARDFLALFPIGSIEECLTKLYRLSKLYKEVQKVFVHYAIPYLRQKEQGILDIAIPYIQQGKLEEALLILKEGTHHEW